MTTGVKKSQRDAESTARQFAIRACRRHLNDLRAAYGRPLPDVAIARSTIPLRLQPAETHSYCTSSAELCAELAK